MADCKVGKAPKGEQSLIHFLAVANTARANCIGDVIYIVISEEERQRFPDLDGAYGIAIEAPTDNRNCRCSVFHTESDFDDEVLAALALCGDRFGIAPTRLQ